jgi:hypothetical protein
MSDSTSSVSVVSIKLEAAIREEHGDRLTGDRLPAVRALCNAVSKLVTADRRDYDNDVVAYKLVMPSCMFVAQVLSISVEPPPAQQHVPMQEVLLQAVRQEASDGVEQVSPEILERVISQTLRCMGNLGYTVGRSEDLTLEEAEEITGA